MGATRWMPAWSPCRSMLPTHSPSRLLEAALLCGGSKATSATARRVLAWPRQRLHVHHVQRVDTPSTRAMSHCATDAADVARPTAGSSACGGIVAAPRNAVAAPEAEASRSLSAARGSETTSWEFWKSIGSPRFVLGPTAGGTCTAFARTRHDTLSARVRVRWCPTMHG